MSNVAGAKAQQNVFQRAVNAVIDLLSSFFLPIINLLVSTGILKGILELLKVAGVVTTDSSTYAILNAMADALFYFIPVFLAYTASKRFGVDMVTGMLIGCILLYPSIAAVMAGDEPVLFFGFELSKVTYSSSVIPILLAIYATSWVQKACYKLIPETFRGLFTPPFCVIVVVPLTLAVFGPLSNVVGGWLAAGYEWVYGLSPLVAGVLVGAFQPFLVILGLHWALFTIALNNIAVTGADTIMALFGGAIFAQGGAALAIALRTQNKKFRSPGGLGVADHAPGNHRARHVRREPASKGPHGVRLRGGRHRQRDCGVLWVRRLLLRPSGPHHAAGVHEPRVCPLCSIAGRLVRPCLPLCLVRSL